MSFKQVEEIIIIKEEKMKFRATVTVLLIVVLLTACNLPGKISPGNSQNPPAGKSTALAPGISPLAPTDTLQPLEPTFTPTITPTDTPSAPMVTPTTEAVNCRFGPGTAYLSIGGLKAGTSVPIIGKNGDGGWWQIQNPNDVTSKCWVAGSATTTSGDVGGVPPVAAPVPFVLKVTAISPANISVPGCMGPIQPISLTGTIDTNGPVSVTWHFETQQGGTLGSHTTVFTKFGPVTVTDKSYTPPVTAGTYWVRLVVTSPNSMKSTDVNYTITCP
jgi:hypothetical protein